MRIATRERVAGRKLPARGRGAGHRAEVTDEMALIVEAHFERNVGAGSLASVEAMNQLKVSAFEMKQALLKGRIDEVGAILDAGWAHKKRTASTVTTPELDAIYEAAKNAGAIGGKVSGAGGGGFMMFLVDPRKRRHVVQALEAFPGSVFATGLTAGGVMSWRVGEDLRKIASLAA